MKISSPRHLLRRERLAALVAEFGGATKLAGEAGTPKSHISALLAGDRGLGDALAAKLEDVAGKPAGWFDAPSDALLPFRDLQPLEALFISYFREMSPDRQQALLIEMQQGKPRPPPSSPASGAVRSSDRPPAHGNQINAPIASNKKDRPK